MSWKGQVTCCLVKLLHLGQNPFKFVDYNPSEDVEKSKKIIIVHQQLQRVTKHLLQSN